MTHEGFLLSRVLLRFDLMCFDLMRFDLMCFDLMCFDHDSDAEDLVGELSAAAISPDGSLWVGV
jgi:hypothetical protein